MIVKDPWNRSFQRRRYAAAAKAKLLCTSGDDPNFRS
jgi:hypothetical protein